MLKGSALANALAIFLIIAGISSSLVLFAYYNRVEFIQLTHKERLINNAFSGINYLVGLPNKVPLNQPIDVDLFRNEKDIVTLKRKLWGAFEIVSSTAKSENSSFSKSAMVGANLVDNEGMALWLADLNKPLSLCGKTELVGTCYLPESGVKRAYIEGQSFVGTQLIKGETKKSERELPKINQEMIEANNAFFLGSISADSSLGLTYLQEHDTMANSFANKTIVFQLEQISLVNKVISGNVIFVASKAIFISQDCKISDALFYAPKIIIEDDFRGQLQVFASDSIYIGKNIELSYPSVVGLIANENKAASSFLTVAESSNIQGVVFGYGANGNQQVQISLNKNVEIEGQVYCSGSVDHKGKIYGSLLCQKLILKTPSSVYENHLLNAVIDNTKLSKHFVGVNLLSKSNSRAIVRWLN